MMMEPEMFSPMLNAANNPREVDISASPTSPISPTSPRRPPLTEELSCDMDSSTTASLSCQRSNGSTRSSVDGAGGEGDCAEVYSSSTTEDDSAIFGSGGCTSTRRNSNAFTDFRDQVNERATAGNGKVAAACKASHHRYSTGGKFTTRCSPRTYSLSEAKTAAALRCLAARKASNADSLLDFLDSNPTAEESDEMMGGDAPDEMEDGVMARISYGRRMSVPERTLLTANYAILRKSIDQRVEIVGAFQKSHSDAYKSFLQSITCYDLAPPHGVVVMLDAGLTLHKAVTIMCVNANSNRAAIVCNAKNRDKQMGIFTVTDCLHVLRLAAATDTAIATSSTDTTPTTPTSPTTPTTTPTKNIGERTLQYFMDNVQCKKKMITSSSDMSAWDVARLFRLNRIHRIPIYQVEDFVQTSEVLSLVCLRAIFVELLKMLDSKCVLEPNLHLLSLEQTGIGTWSNITWLNKDATISDCIDSFIERRVSCIPLLDDERRLVAFLNKDALIDAIAHKFDSFMDVLELPAMSVLMETGADHLSLGSIALPPSASVESAIRMMVAAHRQCVFIVDAGGRLCGVCSFADIMDFLLNTC